MEPTERSTFLVMMTSACPTAITTKMVEFRSRSLTPWPERNLGFTTSVTMMSSASAANTENSRDRKIRPIVRPARASVMTGAVAWLISRSPVMRLRRA